MSYANPGGGTERTSRKYLQPLFHFLLLCFFICTATNARAQNIEDEPIPDDIPAVSKTPDASLRPLPAATATPKPVPTTEVPASAAPAKTFKAPTPTTPAPTASTISVPAAAPGNIEDQAIPDVPPGNIEDEPIPDDIPAVSKTPDASLRPLPTAPAQPNLAPHQHGAASDDMTQLQDENPVQWWQIWRSFTGPEHEFMRRALIAALLVALLCGYLGVYVVLKRIVFVGVALAEMSSAGVALGLLLGFSPLWASALLTLAGTILFSLRLASRRFPNETSIGLVYALAAAVGVMLIAKNAHGEAEMLKLMQGDVLTVDSAETLQMGVVFFVVALAHALFRKEWTLVSFDRDQATTLGWNAGLWDFTLFLSIGISIALSIRAGGVLLTSAMLVMPAATALLLCDRMKNALLVAPILGATSVVLGLHFSLFSFDVPASAASVLFAFVWLFLALIFARVKGRA